MKKLFDLTEQDMIWIHRIMETYDLPTERAAVRAAIKYTGVQIPPITIGPGSDKKSPKKSRKRA